MEIEKIIRSKRKTIALQITDNATLIVKAPLFANERIIQSVIEKHKKWIENKKHIVKSRNSNVLQKEFVDGEVFLYLGKYYKLHIVKHLRVPILFNNDFYLSGSHYLQAKEHFVKLYKKLAKGKIYERVRFYSNLYDSSVSKVTITSAITRWGSCSSKSNLSFTWRLIMAPLQVVDYVVIHELAHIKEKNHSKKFWGGVKTMMPNYEIYKLWLEENGYMLKI